MIARLCAEIRKGSGLRIEFTTGGTGEEHALFHSDATGDHTLSVKASDAARLRAHWDGFMESQPDAWKLPRVGERVTFMRGQYGLWSGTVEGVSQPRDPMKHPRYLTVRFKRRSGTVGRLQIRAVDLTPAPRRES